MADCSRILSRFLSELQTQYSVRTEDDDCIVVTPFLNPDNDPIQLKVKITGDDARISDMGESIGFLYLHGIDLKPTSRQRWFFDTTLRRLGVRATESELVSTVPLSDLPDGLLRMTEAVRSTQHIIMTAKSRSSLSFGDDVEEWLTEGGIQHQRPAEYAGISGKRYVVDFRLEIPKRIPELLYALHSETPGYAGVLANKVVVAFLEIRDAGTKFGSAVLLDDTVDEDVWSSSLPLLHRRIDHVGTWENREELLAAITGH
jgi:hypothetical protein